MVVLVAAHGVFDLHGVRVEDDGQLRLVVEPVLRGVALPGGVDGQFSAALRHPQGSGVKGDDGEALAAGDGGGGQAVEGLVVFHHPDDLFAVVLLCVRLPEDHVAAGLTGVEAAEDVQLHGDAALLQQGQGLLVVGVHSHDPLRTPGLHHVEAAAAVLVEIGEVGVGPAGGAAGGGQGPGRAAAALGEAGVLVQGVEEDAVPLLLPADGEGEGLAQIPQLVVVAAVNVVGRHVHRPSVHHQLGGGEGGLGRAPPGEAAALRLSGIVPAGQHLHLLRLAVPGHVKAAGRAPEGRRQVPKPVVIVPADVAAGDGYPAVVEVDLGRGPGGGHRSAGKAGGRQQQAHQNRGGQLRRTAPGFSNFHGFIPSCIRKFVDNCPHSNTEHPQKQEGPCLRPYFRT